MRQMVRNVAFACCLMLLPASTRARASSGEHGRTAILCWLRSSDPLDCPGIRLARLNARAMTIRLCLREPIPEIADAARYLDAAVSAHLTGYSEIAEHLIRLADMPVIREWTESLWGSNSPYVKPQVTAGMLQDISMEQREKVRMPTTAEKAQIHLRDGYRCRFCGIPVIRREVRERIRKPYSNALMWGRRNPEQHAAFQAMWAQYDHLLPHAKGGSNDLENIVVTCAPCNFGRMCYSLEEVGLADPRSRAPIRSDWDGLERFK
jgi:hypothetical protein